MVSALQTPTYLVPITDPEEIERLRKALGVTEEETEAARERARQSLRDYLVDHPEDMEEALRHNPDLYKNV